MPRCSKCGRQAGLLIYGKCNRCAPATHRCWLRRPEKYEVAALEYMYQTGRDPAEHFDDFVLWVVQ